MMFKEATRLERERERRKERQRGSQPLERMPLKSMRKLKNRFCRTTSI